MTLPIKTTSGIHIQISDQHEDDYIHDRVSILATDPEGFSVLWKLPNRLMRRLDVCHAVAEEIQAELEHRARQAERLGL